MHHYTTKGTCSYAIDIEMDGDIIKSVQFHGGCDGNAQGVSKLVAGMNAHDVINRLQGIQCRNNTSCPDQLSLALAQILAQREQKAGA